MAQDLNALRFSRFMTEIAVKGKGVIEPDQLSDEWLEILAAEAEEFLCHPSHGEHACLTVLVMRFLRDEGAYEQSGGGASLLGAVRAYAGSLVIERSRRPHLGGLRN